MRSRSDIARWGAALTAAAAALVMLPTVADVFLFDDAPVVRDNPLLRSGGLADYFLGNVFGRTGGDRLFRPMLLVSLRLDRALFGDGALAMHLVNVTLHALAAALVFRVLLHLVVDERRALLAALLFAVHPVHLDAVAFIVNRSEMLVVIFTATALLAILYDENWRAWLRGEARADSAMAKAPILLATAAFGCALLSKEMAGGLLPVLLIVLAVRGRAPRAVWTGLLLFATVFAVYWALRLRALAGTNPGDPWITDRRPGVLFPTASRIYADYLRLVIAPYPQLVDRSNFRLSQDALEGAALLTYGLHALVLGFALWLRRRRPSVAIAILGFYATLLPVSHAIPIREIEAERFLYLPSVLACGLIACFEARRATALVVALYGVVCLAESTHFQSAEALWSTMVARSPENPRARYNLGTTLMEAHECDRALPHLEEAVNLLPGYVAAWGNLGRCRVAVGDQDGARVALVTAARLDDENPRAHRNLAVWLATHGEKEAARVELSRARSLRADDPENERVEKLIDAP